MEAKQILTKYWGYTQFRPLQEEIIASVMAGKDTLALLPTGGGKSVCFQVPGLMLGGITVVVSPLIALMKDQVENLSRRGVKAAAIVSGMHKREIDTTLDNCIYGGVQFLYVSPERLTTEIFRERFRKMDVKLIAVDEAHCISQWGYDFRPPYLRIAELQELKEKPVPVIALTATATEQVVADIQEKLEFREKNVFRSSFYRSNLAYIVVKDEDQFGRLRKMARKVQGSTIIYARNRRKTREIAQWLNSQGFSADFYHAGLDMTARSQKQKDWLENKTRIMVATNAFGMGIDKPDVRLVVHLDLPDSPEAYFQEAGRAGRDEKKAFAVLVWHAAEVEELENRVQTSFPERHEIKQVYQALGNHYQLAIGAGMDAHFPFDLRAFCERHQLKTQTAYHSLKILELDEYVKLSEVLSNVSKIKIELPQEDLYKYQIANRQMDGILKLLLRSYSGLFEQLTKISEFDLARRAKISQEAIVEHLNKLAAQEVISYVPKSDLPVLSFPFGRLDTTRINISKESYEERKEKVEARAAAIINYAKSDHKCRSQLLLNYFDEPEAARCGICDVCLERNKLELSNLEFEEVSEQIKKALNEERLSLTALVNAIKGREDKTVKVVQWLSENGKLKLDMEGKYYWYSKNS